VVKDNRQQVMMHISGKVQGVWFRQSTKHYALQHAISGYAKNLADGSVEVLAIGTSENIAALTAYLHHGPEQARVDSLVVKSQSDLYAALSQLGQHGDEFMTL